MGVAAAATAATCCPRRDAPRRSATSDAASTANTYESHWTTFARRSLPPRSTLRLSTKYSAKGVEKSWRPSGVGNGATEWFWNQKKTLGM